MNTFSQLLGVITIVPLDLAVKATVLLTIVLAIQGAIGRSRASLGSALGNVALIALLLLPCSTSATNSSYLPSMITWIQLISRRRNPRLFSYRTGAIRQFHSLSTTIATAQDSHTHGWGPASS